MNCKTPIHPFQYDTGISQNQRVMNDLLDGPALLDGRTMADMLGYFVKFSRQINFYDEDGSKKDWRPFFEKSLPFITASILNFQQEGITTQLAAYQKKFLRRPSAAGLDILINYIYTKILKPFAGWERQLQDSGLPIGNVLDGLIKKDLTSPCERFIRSVNTAVRTYHLPVIDFTALFQPGAAPWNFTADTLSAALSRDEMRSLGRNKRARLIALYTQVAEITSPFLRAINASTGAAGISLQQSFESLQDSLKQKHQPHLALIFAFLNLFRQLQDSLNGYTKKHLDFFYRQVLAFLPKDAAPDKTHIVFAIQKQMSGYALKKGVTLKGPKDNNKADILFALDDELVVNQAQVTDIRTLYVNDLSVSDASYVQGVYMAPVATKADGVDKDFQEGVPVSWPTVGARYSKYSDPENKFVRAYPNARLGLVLASPVLLLNEGARTIAIQLKCTWKNKHCPDKNAEDPNTLYQQITDALDKTWYYVNQDLIKAAVKAGIDPATEQSLRQFLIKEAPSRQPIYEATIPAGNWPKFSDAVKTSLSPFFPPQLGLNITFSGDKDWISPKNVAAITAGPLTAIENTNDYTFDLTITSTLQLDEPPVTFYNKDSLKEDLNTTLPAARILLNDKIKLSLPAIAETKCCLRPPDTDQVEVSLYHFFRNVLITNTNISVKACGLKKFIVQNDESIQDVNKPVYPFGTRPTVIGFDRVTRVQPDTPAATPNLIGPNFYIGSQEIFCKKWKNVTLNLSWKDKPSNFEDYYRAYWVNKSKDPATPLPRYGLAEKDFQINIAVLQKQNWLAEKKDAPFTAHNETTDAYNRQLFFNDGATPGCPATAYKQSITLTNTSFDNFDQGFHIDPAAPLTKYEASTQYGFIRINLQNQDFLHKDYAYVLARQMMALSKLSGTPGEGNDQFLKLEDAVYYDKNGDPVVFSTDQIGKDIEESKTLIDDVQQKTNDELAQHVLPNSTSIPSSEADHIRYALYHPNSAAGGKDFIAEVNTLQQNITADFAIIGGSKKNFQAIIPNEPWTPIIQGISLDYEADATDTDVTLIHLYPFAGAYKKEELSQSPSLFPTFCDEGCLFLGLTALAPGSNLNILFQLAEATSDTEEDPTPLQWSYLDNNTWKPLRTGFEIVDDATDELSTSGIIKFAIPGNISDTNTVMPTGLSWIKASIARNSGIVAETIAIYTQAIQATFTNTDGNDKERLDVPLPANSLSRLETADANIKKVDQPFDSFGGRVPESDGYFYVRVSETLRHKGRAIQRCDYERIALDAFPQLFKAKCINHSFGLNAHKYADDYPMAPGYVLLAVIPDLNKLKAAASFEPRVPLSLLEALEIRMAQLTSPFVRFRAMNPRYEKVDFYLQVQLLPGKDPIYYKQRLQDDIRQFMAPWSVGEFDKLRFGQVINRSDVLRFLETRDYLDYVLDWRWRHDEDEVQDGNGHTKKAPLSADDSEIFPITPRSILIAGLVDVSILDKYSPGWDKTPITDPLNMANIYKNG